MSEPAPLPPSARDVYERELGERRGRSPLVQREMEEGVRSLHFVLDAGRCYRFEGIAQTEIALTLRDEHGHELGRAIGRTAVLDGVCPRWSGSFEVRVELRGPRGRVSLFDVPDPTQPSAASSAGLTRSMTR